MYPNSEISTQVSGGFTMESFYVPDMSKSFFASGFKFMKPE